MIIYCRWEFQNFVDVNPDADRDRIVRSTTADGAFTLQYRFRPTIDLLNGNVSVYLNDLKWDFLIDLDALRSLGWLQANDTLLAVTGSIRHTKRPVICEDDDQAGAACFGDDESLSYVRWLNVLDCEGEKEVAISSVVYGEGSYHFICSSCSSLYFICCLFM